MTQGAHIPKGDLQLLGIKVSQEGGGVHYFEGAKHGLSTSIYEGAVAPGSGPGAHTHPYAEFFVLCEGRGIYTIGDDTFEAEAGDVVVVPAGVSHDFVNPGETMLKHISIHEAPVHAGSHLQKKP